MEPSFYGVYPKLAEEHWWFQGRRAIITSVLRRFAPPEGTSVFDIGCGPGDIIHSLRKLGYTARGGDPNAAAVSFAHSRGLSDTLHLTHDTIPLPDGSFDVVTCFDVLEHLPHEEPLLREAFRLLRPGGYCMVTVPAFPALWGIQDEVSHHYRRYRRNGLAETIARTGFSVELATYFNTLLFLPVSLIRLVSRFVPPHRSSDFFPVPRFVNHALASLLHTEARFVGRIPMPFGVSIVAVARKPLT